MAALAATSVYVVWRAYNKEIEAPLAAIIVGFLVAFIGWIIAAYTARRTSRKQHTMAVLTQARLSTEHNNRVRNVREKFPPGTTISEVEFASPANAQVMADCRYMLNYYEFLAAALRHGDLDHRLLKDCVRGQLCDFYREARVVVDHAIRTDPRGAEKSKRYCEIRRLFKKWEKG